MRHASWRTVKVAMKDLTAACLSRDVISSRDMTFIEKKMSPERVPNFSQIKIWNIFTKILKIKFC